MTLVHSAGIVPVKITGGEAKFLLVRSGDYFDFPKGKLDNDESHKEAAIRELAEESGLTDVDFVWGDEYKETLPYPTKSNKKKVKKIARYYVAQVKSGDVILLPNPLTGIVEHQEAVWVSYREAELLSLKERIREVLCWAAEVVENSQF